MPLRLQSRRTVMTIAAALKSRELDSRHLVDPATEVVVPTQITIRPRR